MRSARRTTTATTRWPTKSSKVVHTLTTPVADQGFAGRSGTKSIWFVYARHLIGTWHGRNAHQAFGQTEAIALRALAQQFRNRHD